MPTVNPITVLNIDETPFAVESLSEEVQALVEVYNAWNQKETDAAGELAILQAAKQTLSAQIVAKVREEQAVAATANVTTAEPEGDGRDEAVAAETEASAQDAVIAAD